jgi:hypothetical protein
MEPKPRYMSRDAAILTVKVEGLLRLVAIISAFMFWYLTAILLLFFYTSGILPPLTLLSVGQAALAVGLAPIPVALATWKAFEWVYAVFLTAYAKKHFLD